MELTESVLQISGVGEKTRKMLDRVGIATVHDLLYYLPRAYKDFTTVRKLGEVQLGEKALFCVRLNTAPKTRRIRQGLEITSFKVSDETAVVSIDIFNQTYIKTYLKQGDAIYIYGKLICNMCKPAITAPEIYFKKPEDPFLPMYPLTAGLNQNMLRKFVKAALKSLSLQELYSAEFLQKFDIMGLSEALFGVHFPKDISHAEAAHARIVFDELLVFCRMIELLNEEKAQSSNIRIDVSTEQVLDYTKKLGFEPTNAQKKVMSEIAADLGKQSYMNRLVQGDVGCGKTALAFFAMDCLVRHGYQSVMLAPTEILVQQHHCSASALFNEEDIVLVTGALTAKQKKELHAKIRDGSAKIIIGTHALLYGGIEFHKLGLLITDEQHRFGVKQRAALTTTGTDVHSLIMSATPIPRSLALVLYGKTDISIVDELPPGRKAIKTYIIRKSKYNDMIGFIKNELMQGRQAYVVCPLIEESENFDARSAQEMFAEIKQCYAGIAVELLHGKLKNAQKQQIMQDFVAGEIKILVSTTVIEVGVNVPNASVMAVLNAERFGLAQLHQLRGRVGRGSAQSYCFLVSDNQNAYERLKVMSDTNDGFVIAEKDMQFRGTGDVFGTRQHGQGALQIANLIQDSRQLEKAREVLGVLRKNACFVQEYTNITRVAECKMREKLLEIALN